MIAAAISALSLAAEAASLGNIHVHSGLGQPLRAEIQLGALPQEMQSLNVRIASPEAFRSANLSYGAAASAIRLSLDSSAARPVIRLSSERPINDPFVDLLIELTWASGRLAREYTFLLDPVDLPLQGGVPVQVTAPVARPPAPVPRPAVAAAVVPVVRSAASTHVVRPGDSASRIAALHAIEGATQEQVLLALLLGNARAFDGGNINRLRAGAVLDLPGAEAVFANSADAARSAIRAQREQFEADRREAAAVAGQSAPAGDASADQSSAGEVRVRADEPAPAVQGGDRVRVSAGRGGAEAGDAEARLVALEEELSASEKSLEEANQRLLQLEQSLRDLQQLIALDANGARHDRASAAAPAAPVAAPVAPAADVAEASPLDDPQLMGAGAAVVLLLLAYALLKARQRRSAAKDDSEGEDYAEAPVQPKQSAVFAGNGGQTVDTSAASVVGHDFSQQDLTSIDTEEGVDAVSEADVYIAYGRDEQAEEILLDALKASAGRPEIYLKLLEIYLARGDAERFNGVASDLNLLTQGKGEDWKKAATMGRQIDPDNPLYPIIYDKNGLPLLSRPAAAPPPGRVPAAAGVAAGVAAASVAAGHRDAPPMMPAAAEAAAVLELPSLDFGTPDPAPAPAPAATTPPAAAAAAGEVAAAPEKQALELDNGLDFEIFNTDEEPAATDAAQRAAENLKRIPPDRITEVDLEKTSFDSSLLDFGLDIEPREAGDGAPPAPIDFSAIDLELDLGGDDADSEPEPAPVVAPVLAPAGGTGVRSEPHGLAGTWLELARAHAGMGDREGAQQLLRDVLEHGSEQQKSVAREILARLG